jgi:alpha-beta hydrolase superfamily lysophospholipase
MKWIAPLRWLRRVAVLAAVALAAVLAVRAYDSQRGPPLQPWHLVVPPEPDSAAIAQMDWGAWLAAEAAAFATVDREVTGKLPADARGPLNRYDPASPMWPGRFAQDFNRSLVLEPAGPPRGAVVLVHGLTDAPYSMRHVAALYRDRGFVAIVPRMPGHGTVPAALASADWRDWLAATHLAMHEARRRAGAGAPLHLVGYSNGGAMALLHALAALDDAALPAPDRLVLISPMVGVTEFARFAGIAAWPALLPRFAKAAWLGIVPEFNPFKYNSFPVNAARQSWQVTQALQARLAAAARSGAIARLAPVLTVQSVLDATVSTRAVVNALYGVMPANGSTLVLIDINRAAQLGPLLRPAEDVALDRLLPPAPRAFNTVVLANAAPGDLAVVERVTRSGSTEATERRLSLAFPADVFSLSHVALPFPPHDGLYGSAPDGSEDFGIRLGTVAARGERGALVVPLDVLLRQNSNPLFADLRARIDAVIPPP